MKLATLVAILSLAGVSALIGASGCIRPTPVEPIAKKGSKVIPTKGRVVGYFTNWAQYRKECKFTPEDIDGSLLTHINYAFAKIEPGPGGKEDPEFRLAPYEYNDLGANGLYRQVNGLKKHKYPHLKTLISVGGWGFNDPPTAWIFTTLAGSEKYRKAFAQDSIRYAREWGFDGIDLDWEYPGVAERGGRPEDPANFTALVRDMREAFREEAKATGKSELLLTMAAGASESHYKYLELREIPKYLDFINVMTYDYNGAWAKVAGANAPLLDDSRDNGPGFVKKTVDAFLAGGVPANQLVVGMPTYGRSWSGVPAPDLNATATGAGPRGFCTGADGQMAYFEVQEALKAKKFEKHWDDRTGTPFAYNAKSQSLVTYDDVRSIGMKADYVMESELGGAMFWALDFDDFKNGYPLISTVAKRMQ